MKNIWKKLFKTSYISTGCYYILYLFGFYIYNKQVYICSRVQIEINYFLCVHTPKNKHRNSLLLTWTIFHVYPHSLIEAIVSNNRLQQSFSYLYGVADGACWFNGVECWGWAYCYSLFVVYMLTCTKKKKLNTHTHTHVYT